MDPSLSTRRLVAGPALGLALGLALWACGQSGSHDGDAGSTATTTSAAAQASAPGPRAPAREGSSIARAPDDSALFVADEDHSAVVVVPLPLRDDTAATTVHVPGRPAQLLTVGRRVLVTLRDVPEGGGALLVLERDGATGLREVGRAPVAADAWGLALSADESFVLISSAWTARVSSVDLGTLKVVGTVDVGREPRGITILPDGSRAYVSHLVGSAVTRIDDLRSGSPRATRLDLPAAPVRAAAGKNLPASLGYAAVASPEGDRVWFARHALGALGGDAWFGAAAVDVLGTAKDEPLAPARRHGMPKAAAPFFDEIVEHAPWQDGVQDVTPSGVTAFVQPRAAVYRAREQTLLVASEGTDSLVELDATLLDPTLGLLRSYPTGQHGNAIYDVATEGGAPSGIALSADQDVAYVFCRSTDELVSVRLVRGEGAYISLPPTVVRLAPETADESLSLGRRLFYNATDRITSGGLGCAGCHPDGRDDGHTWHETPFAPSAAAEVAAVLRSPSDDSRQFVNLLGSADNAAMLEARWKVSPTAIEGERAAPRGVGHARQTPMLAGRVSGPGPYGWHGASEDLTARIVTGFALHRWKDEQLDANNARARAAHLTKFLREGLVPPARAKRALTEDEQRGKAVFESPAAGCAGCHVPAEQYQNHTAVPLRRLPPRVGFASEEKAEFKTPSLLHVGGTAPYFHDGRYETLESLIELNGDGMGRTSHLSADDKRALVAFMRTL